MASPLARPGGRLRVLVDNSGLLLIGAALALVWANLAHDAVRGDGVRAPIRRQRHRHGVFLRSRDGGSPRSDAPRRPAGIQSDGRNAVAGGGRRHGRSSPPVRGHDHDAWPRGARARLGHPVCHRHRLQRAGRPAHFRQIASGSAVPPHARDCRRRTRIDHPGRVLSVGSAASSRRRRLDGGRDGGGLVAAAPPRDQLLCRT